MQYSFQPDQDQDRKMYDYLHEAINMNKNGGSFVSRDCNKVCGDQDTDGIGSNFRRKKRKRTANKYGDDIKSCYSCCCSNRDVCNEYMKGSRIEDKLLHVYRLLKTQSDLASSVYKNMWSQQQILSNTLHDIISEQEQLIEHNQAPHHHQSSNFNFNNKNSAK